MTAAELIRDFVNTRDLLDDEEHLDSPRRLEEWLEGRGLPVDGDRTTTADLGFARALREALRRLLLANNGVDVDTAEALAVLDEVAARSGIRLSFAAGAAALVPGAGGVSGALGRILVAVHDAMADGSWPRLKACRAPDCEWAFIDNARNHSRAWCSMKSCGNREKARAYRRRHA